MRPALRCLLCDRAVRVLIEYLAPSGTRRKACPACIETSPYVVEIVEE